MTQEIWTICRIFKRNMSYNRRCQQQKQEHGSKRSQQQQQLQYYYDYRYHHQHGASMTSSFDSSEASEAYPTDHHQPFLLHGLHGVSSAKTTTTTTSSGLMGAPLLPSVSVWSELTTFRDSGSTWDELGRIMEI